MEVIDDDNYDYFLLCLRLEGVYIAGVTASEFTLQFSLKSFEVTGGSSIHLICPFQQIDNINAHP
ncbi:hypothetical protein OUZ56_006802 [Daphnia magna]|uniref:Uncharacterized protein n=1 Tax=Daphnia magna TaxID=35525 RepID=A0ABQ9YWQ6_9CRUS|nr:hypothetical protein OUZ56_006802 [Daphnia magna]